MRKKQVFNTFLPLNEYIPDGELTIEIINVRNKKMDMYFPFSFLISRRMRLRSGFLIVLSAICIHLPI